LIGIRDALQAAEMAANSVRNLLLCCRLMFSVAMIALVIVVLEGFR
jgi:hypothetical protein